MVAIFSVIVIKGAIQFGNQTPIYQTNLMGFIDTFTRYVPSQEYISLNSTLRSITSILISLMRSSISGLVNIGTTAGIIILATAFLLIDAANTPKKITSKFETQSKLQMSISKFDKNLVGFLAIRAETNLITSVGITIALLVGDIDFAILWGVLIFLLSYITLHWSRSGFYSTHNACTV